MYVLLVIYFTTPSNLPFDQKPVLQASSAAECEEARRLLLAVPGYDPAHVVCLPGRLGLL